MENGDSIQTVVAQETAAILAASLHAANSTSWYAAIDRIRCCAVRLRTSWFIMEAMEIAADTREIVAAVYRDESRRVFATLVRLLGDFDLAEEAMHDAFASAIEQWPREGVPANPRAWLVSAGRFKAIDVLRRRARFDASLATLAERLDADNANVPEPDERGIDDDRLRLIFTCCHPRVAVGGPPRAHAARSLRPHDRGNRPRILDRRRDNCPTHRPCQSKNQKRRDPLPGAVTSQTCPTD